MIAFLITALITGMAALGQTDRAELSEVPEPSLPAEPSPIVEIKQTDPVRLIYLQHNEPYWTAGPVFSRVREYMQQHNEPGPMFMRYQRKTEGVRAVSRTSDIGFIAKRDHEPEAPFRAERAESRGVAQLVVSGKTASPWRWLAVLDVWAGKNGYEYGPEVMEVYHLGPGPAGDIERTEIQVALLRRREIIEEPDDLVRALPRSLATNPVTHTEVSESAPDEVIAKKPEPASISTAPRPSASATRRVLPQGESTWNTRGDPKTESIATDVAAGKFGRVAEAVLSRRARVDAETQIWLGQVVFRIKAAANGIEQKHPGRGAAAKSLATALVQRYRTLFAATQIDPFALSMPLVGRTSDGQAAKRKAIMRDLDRLLGHIAFNSVSPEQALSDIVSVLTRVREFIQT